MPDLDKVDDVLRKRFDAVIQDITLVIGGSFEDRSQRGSVRYSASVTCSPQVNSMSLSSVCWMARWVMKVSRVAPCQCHTPGSVMAKSPAWMWVMGPPRSAISPVPSM